MTDALVAVDLGTAGAKAALIGVDGSLLAQSIRRYPTIEGPDPTWVEQDPEAWWEAVRGALGEVAAAGRGHRPVALCVGGQGPSLVPVEGSGEAAGNSLIWKDRRVGEERAWISGRAGREVPPYSSVPKALWIKRHRPEVFARTRWFLQAWDYIAHRLTGAAVASTFPGGAVFPPDLLAAAELDPALFPAQTAMGSVTGMLGPEVARDLGLPAGIPVAGGVNDSTASVVGGGLVSPGIAMDFGGSSGGLGLCVDKALKVAGISANPGPLPGLWVCGGPLAAGGLAFEWVTRTMGFGLGGFDSALSEAARMPAGSDGLVFLPHLAGERAPIWDEGARGAFYGITDRHERGHMVRAVLEGVAFALRHIADVLDEAGAPIDRLRVAGGQARGELWNRIKADVLGCPVDVPAVTETALAGYAILAGIAAGLVPDIASGARALVRIERRLEPDPSARPALDRGYRAYRALQHAVRGVGPPA